MKFMRVNRKTAAFLLAAVMVALGLPALAFNPPPAPHNALVKPAILDGLLGNKRVAPQSRDESKYYIHDAESFAEKTTPFNLVPFSKPELEFTISIPEDWEKVSAVNQDMDNLGLSQQILGNIAEFRSPLIYAERANILIQRMNLEHEIDAGSWLRNHILVNGYSIHGNVSTEGLKKASAHYIATTSSGSSIFVYIRAWISANVIMLVQYEAPLSLKKYMEYAQQSVIDSFKLISPREDPIESTSVFTLADAAKFSFPSSWQIASPDLRNMNHLSVEIHNKNASRVVQGYARVVAIRRSSDLTVMGAIRSIHAFIGDQMNLSFDEMLYTYKAPVYSRFMFNRYEIYEVTSKVKKRHPQELRIAVLGDDQWYIFAFLLTPREQDNLYTWARNVRSFESLLSSIM